MALYGILLPASKMRQICTSYTPVQATGMEIWMRVVEKRGSYGDSLSGNAANLILPAAALRMDTHPQQTMP